MIVKKGSKIKVDYTGTLDDGTVFDSSEKHGQPLEFEVGSGMIIKGFDTAVVGMKKGEEKSIHLNPSEAYGDINPQMIKEVPKDKMPPGALPGMMLAIMLPTGQQIPAKIKEMTDTSVTLDLNHPLAGKALNFKIKVVDIS